MNSFLKSLAMLAILWAFGIGSALVAVAGILIAFDTDMTLTMGFRWLLYGVVAMIIGGVGRTWGLVGGGVAVGDGTAFGFTLHRESVDGCRGVCDSDSVPDCPSAGFSDKRLKKVEV